MSTTLVMEVTCVGVARVTVSPSAVSPVTLRPHAQRVPSFLSATANAAGHVTAFTFVNPGTCVGRSRRNVVPSPSWPKLFWPHIHNVPSALIAHATFEFIDTNVTPARSWIACGEELAPPPGPLPLSWRLDPHERTEASEASASVDDAPRPSTAGVAAAARFIELSMTRVACAIANAPRSSVTFNVTRWCPACGNESVAVRPLALALFEVRHWYDTMAPSGSDEPVASRLTATGAVARKGVAV